MCLDIVTPALKAAPSPVAAPSSTPTAFPFKKGDKVRILRRASTNENGWNNAWASEMDKAIGQVGTVSLVIPRDKDVTVDVPGISRAFGYPVFALELVNEAVVPVETVTTVTTKKTAPVEFAPGQRVRVDYPDAPQWNGEGVVDYVSSYGSVVVKFNRKGWTDRGGFQKKFVTILEDAPTTRVVEVPAVLAAPYQPTVAPTSGLTALQVARELAVSLAKQNPARTVTMDWVQEELTKRGFTSADLGNAAGVVFKGGQFENTGMTAKSLRIGNNRRKITVWKYIGQDAPAPTVSGPFIVQLSHDGGVNWSRSSNAPGTYPTFEEARAEADRQHARNGYLYQAAPLNGPSVPVPVKISSQSYIVEALFSDGNWARSGNKTEDGKSLSQHVFSTLEEAEKAASFQMSRGIRQYRAVPYTGR